MQRPKTEPNIDYRNVSGKEVVQNARHKSRIMAPVMKLSINFRNKISAKTTNISYHSKADLLSHLRSIYIAISHQVELCSDDEHG